MIKRYILKTGDGLLSTIDWNLFQNLLPPILDQLTFYATIPKAETLVVAAENYVLQHAIHIYANTGAGRKME